MVNLTVEECRVLGTLIEKAHTTPQQYPLTLNALISGCNQKSCRDPVVNMTEDDVLGAIDTLRSKGLVREVMLSGSRVAKFRHNARETLNIETPALVVLTELLLRGPQTVGELRGRATRMHTIETVEQVQQVLHDLAHRDEPMVTQLPPAPGSRAPRFAQLLCPELNDHASAPVATASTVSPPTSASSANLEQRVAVLEQQVAELRDLLTALQSQAGSSYHGAAD